MSEHEIQVLAQNLVVLGARAPSFVGVIAGVMF